MPLDQEARIAEAIISGRHSYQIETDKGVFVCHTRVFRDDRKIGTRRDQLIADDGGDPRLASSATLMTYYMQALLETVIDKQPEGFVLEAADSDFVGSLFTKVTQCEDNFRKNGNKPDGKGSKK